MKVRLIQIGKTDSDYLARGIDEYKKRVSHYLNIEEITLKCLDSATKQGVIAQKNAEGKLILGNVTGKEPIILLDEKGKEFTSIEFAEYLRKTQNQHFKRINFCIGGPFGFSDEVLKNASQKISFSKMTFSHQMIRLFFWEQLYRANTILKGEKYHHK